MLNCLLVFYEYVLCNLAVSCIVVRILFIDRFSLKTSFLILSLLGFPSTFLRNPIYLTLVFVCQCLRFLAIFWLRLFWPLPLSRPLTLSILSITAPRYLNYFTFCPLISTLCFLSFVGMKIDLDIDIFWLFVLFMQIVLQIFAVSENYQIIPNDQYQKELNRSSDE